MLASKHNSNDADNLDMTKVYNCFKEAGIFCHSVSFSRDLVKIIGFTFLKLMNPTIKLIR